MARKPGISARQVIRKALEPKGLQPKKTIHRTNALTDEEKDERRRVQNREAQRRFRERHMLDEYRKASSTLQMQLLGWLHVKEPIDS
jgi:23S rRNA maturation mini-RNase III